MSRPAGAPRLTRLERHSLALRQKYGISDLMALHVGVGVALALTKGLNRQEYQAHLAEVTRRTVQEAMVRYHVHPDLSGKRGLELEEYALSLYDCVVEREARRLAPKRNPVRRRKVK